MGQPGYALGVLQSLARHSTIVTALTFYAQHDAELTADAVWEAMA